MHGQAIIKTEMGASFPGNKTTAASHFYSVLSLKMIAAILLLPEYAFMACALPSNDDE
jgi:hypothetical protein